MQLEGQVFLGSAQNMLEPSLKEQGSFKGQCASVFSRITLCSRIFQTVILSIFLADVKFLLHGVSGGTLVLSGAVEILHWYCQVRHGAWSFPVQSADLSAFLLQQGYPS